MTTTDNTNEQEVALSFVLDHATLILTEASDIFNEIAWPEDGHGDFNRRDAYTTDHARTITSYIKEAREQLDAVEAQLAKTPTSGL